MVQSARTGGGQSPETITYALDDVGNRSTVTGGPDAGTYSLNTADSLLNLYTSTPAGANTYDDNATLQSRGAGAADLRYDYRDRLIEYEDIANNRLHRFAYDALGRRISKTTDVGTSQERIVQYSYDGGWNVVAEYDGADNVIATCVYEDGLDALVQIERDNSGAGSFAAMAVHSDDLSSVLALTNASGGLIEEYEYRDYGQIVDPSTMANFAGSSIGNTAFYTGREWDEETGLYQFRHRYLDPSAGRFVSRDPIGPWGDTANIGNGQAYCGNNPWSRIDPLGLNCAYPAGLLPPPIRGDTRTGSSDPEGVKGDCAHHGSAKGKEGKSGERLSDNEYQAKRRQQAACAAAQAGPGAGRLMFCLASAIDAASDSTSDSARLSAALDIAADSVEGSGGVFGRGGSGASTGLEPMPGTEEIEVPLGLEILSEVAESAPFSGQLMSGWGVIFGKNPITGQAVSRLGAASNFIPVVKWGKGIWKWGSKGVKWTKRLWGLGKATEVAAGRALHFADSQWGEKAGRHAWEWGLDASKAADRDALMSIAKGICGSPDRVVSGTFRGQGAVEFYIKGSDVVIGKGGEFVSILKGGISNPKVIEALGQ